MAKDSSAYRQGFSKALDSSLVKINPYDIHSNSYWDWKEGLSDGEKHLKRLEKRKHNAKVLSLK